MKKRNLRSYTISTCLVLGLLLTGCAGTEAVSTEGDVTTEAVAENSTVDTNTVTITGENTILYSIDGSHIYDEYYRFN